MRDLERFLLLRSIDTNWVQHLTTMENLRQGIGLQAFGQRDPLAMYRIEGNNQFQALEQKIQSDVAHSIFRVPADMGQLAVNGSRGTNGAGRAIANRGSEPSVAANGASQNRRSPAPAPQTRGRRRGRQPVGAVAAPTGRRKIGRNQPCPCGSGKKYKRCCAA